MKFDKAIISLLDGRTIETKITSVHILPNGFIEIKAVSGITYYTQPINCVLIKE